MASLPDLTNERVRAYVYRVLLAVVPVLTGYGILSEQQVSAWLGLAAALLGVTLATKNTSTKKEN